MKNAGIKYIRIVLICLLILSCGSKILWRENHAVSYGMDDIQHLDISIPVNADNTVTAMLFIHGYDTTGKLQYWTLIDNYREKFIVGNMNYRIPVVQDNISMNELLKDVDGATAAMKKAAEASGIQIKNLILIGYSLGGAMALNYGYSDIQPKTHDIPVRFCVCLAGVSDFSDPSYLDVLVKQGIWPDMGYIIPLFSVLSEHNITPDDITSDDTNGLRYKEETAAALKNISAVNYVSTDTPPTIIAHSADDYTVPYSNSVNLHNALNAARIPNVFLETSDKLGHGLGARLLNYKVKMDDALEKALIEAINTYIAEYCE